MPEKNVPNLKDEAMRGNLEALKLYGEDEVELPGLHSDEDDSGISQFLDSSTRQEGTEAKDLYPEIFDTAREQGKEIVTLLTSNKKTSSTNQSMLKVAAHTDGIEAGFEEMVRQSLGIPGETGNIDQKVGHILGELRALQGVLAQYGLGLQPQRNESSQVPPKTPEE